MGNLNCCQTETLTQCQICLMEDFCSNFIILSACSHKIHETCLKSYLENLINQNKNILSIKCPIQDCNTQIPNNKVTNYLKQSSKQKYLKLTLDAYVQKSKNTNFYTYYCPTADCPAIYEILKEQMDDIDTFECSICSKTYCTKCRQPQHQNKACNENREQNNEDQQFYKAVKKNKFQKCPNCLKWVQKTQGCDHITCTCEAQFCYQCGKLLEEKCEHLQFLFTQEDNSQLPIPEEESGNPQLFFRQFLSRLYNQNQIQIQQQNSQEISQSQNSVSVVEKSSQQISQNSLRKSGLKIDI